MEKEFTISMPGEYKQQTISMEYGAQLIYVQQFVVVKVEKDSITHKHKHFVEIPLHFTVQDPRSEQRAAVDLSNSASGKEESMVEL